MLLKIVFSALLAGAVLLPSPAAVAQPSISIRDPPLVCRPIPKRPDSRAHQYVGTELFFGTETPAEPVTEARFLSFLDAEITPRFPTG